MNLLFKYKLFIFILTFFLFPNLIFAQTSTCSSVGYTVLTINGIFTNQDEAIYNKDALKFQLKKDFNNQPLTVDFLYNPTHLAGFGDLVDAVQQGLFDQKSDYDLIEMLNDASQKVTTQKLLLVAHSQGNFYANNFYDKVASQEGGVPSQSIGVYGVASPANRVAGKGKYLTSNTDNVIASVVARFINILPPNINIPLQANDGNGHSFSDVYLKYQGDRIISDIKSSLNKLQENDEQATQYPCISPPELTAIHKIQGVVLAIADPTAIIVKDGIVVTYNTGVYVATGIYNTGLVIGNTTINIANTLASNISSLAQSLFNNTKTLAANNPASVISANNDTFSAMAENVSSNNIPESTKENSKIITKTPVPKNAPVENSTPTLGAETLPTPETTEVSSPVPVVPVAVFHGGGGVTGTSSIPTPQTEKDSSNPDTTSPIISIVGDNSVEVIKNSTYTDAGATAFDEKDGTVNIVTTGTVNTAVVGIYTITYTATDLSNNIATASRTVNVVEPPLPDTTPPDVPTVDALSQFTNTDDIIVSGTAESNSTITINGGTSTVTGVATDGNFSISVPLNQNVLNTLSVTAIDEKNNTSNPATVSTTHDNIPPVISSIVINEPRANIILVGGTFGVTINTDGYGYTAGAITINEIPADNFTGSYTHYVSHTVALGETDRSSGAVPVSVVLTDPAGNSNVAYTTVAGNGLVINGHFPISVTQVFPSFNSSDGKFTQDVVLPCVTNSGYFEMYYIADSDSFFNYMNTSAGVDTPYTVNCSSNQKTVISSGMGFEDFLGYPSPAVAGWYQGAVPVGYLNCANQDGSEVCVEDKLQSFFRLHRSVTGVWSDTTPTLVSAEVTSENTIDLTFSKDLLGTTDSPLDFSVAEHIIISTAEITPGVVRLTISDTFAVGETPEIVYNTTVSNGVKDLAGNVVPEKTIIAINNL